MIRIIAALVTAVLSFPAIAREPSSPIFGRASVIDGDTIEIRGQRIRLFGIDAPESRQTCTDAQGVAYRCGQKAAQALDYRISDGVVTCEPKDRDRYGRVVAVCRAYGEDLSAWMTGLGWALAFRRYSTQYVPAEELAERRKAGMWSGQFVPPWEWRAEPRRQTKLSTGRVPRLRDPGGISRSSSRAAGSSAAMRSASRLRCRCRGHHASMSGPCCSTAPSRAAGRLANGSRAEVLGIDGCDRRRLGADPVDGGSGRIRAPLRALL